MWGMSYVNNVGWRTLTFCIYETQFSLSLSNTIINESEWTKYEPIAKELHLYYLYLYLVYNFWQYSNLSECVNIAQ